MIAGHVSEPGESTLLRLTQDRGSLHGQCRSYRLPKLFCTVAKPTPYSCQNRISVLRIIHEPIYRACFISSELD